MYGNVLLQICTLQWETNKEGQKIKLERVRGANILTQNKELTMGSCNCIKVLLEHRCSQWSGPTPPATDSANIFQYRTYILHLLCLGKYTGFHFTRKIISWLYKLHGYRVFLVIGSIYFAEKQAEKRILLLDVINNLFSSKIT